MAFEYTFSGKSGTQYAFVLTDITDRNALLVQGGLMVIAQNDPEKPVFIGGMECIQNGFDTFDIWPKVGFLPAPVNFYFMALVDSSERHNALNDLVAHYAPPLNKKN
jgi:hypothetical protein